MLQNREVTVHTVCHYLLTLNVPITTAANKHLQKKIQNVICGTIVIGTLRVNFAMSQFGNNKTMEPGHKF